jgi:membrane protease YdiL (CAAX protease family)
MSTEAGKRRGENRDVREEIFGFFALALSFTWAFQMPGVLAQSGLLPGGVEPYLPLVVVGVFGPTVAALVILKRSGEKGAVRTLLRRMVSPRPSVRWIVLALLLPGVLLTAALGLAGVFGREGPLFYFPDPVGRILVGAIIACAEEVGWRGFALGRLSSVMGRLRGSLILGVLWAVWHVPMFLGQAVPMDLMPVMLLFFTGGSVVFTWFYFRLKQNLVIVVMLHWGCHLNNSHLALPGDVSPLIAQTLAWCLLAAGLIVFDPQFWQRNHLEADVYPSKGPSI